MSALDGFCFDPCNACGHTHYGFASRYRCPKCGCSDRHDCERDKCSQAKKAAA